MKRVNFIYLYEIHEIMNATPTSFMRALRSLIRFTRTLSCSLTHFVLLCEENFINAVISEMNEMNVPHEPHE